MRKFLALLALSLLLVSCATSSRPVVTGEIISYATIYRELRPLMTEERSPKVFLMDAYYGSVSEGDTRRMLNEGLARFRFVTVNEARDCDDAALELTLILRHIFRRETRNVPLAAPIGLVGGALVGDIPELKYVSPGVPLLHAMVAVRCQGGKWLLVEPASKQITELTGPIYEGCFEPFVGVF